MPQYITKDDLVRIRGEILAEERQRIVKNASARAPEGSTFLSYSSKDGDLLPAVVRVLQNEGAHVYIDRFDPELPTATSKTTASLLRDRIRLCRKFVLFATQNSKDSRWVPWELGLSDAFKSSAATAVFPSVDSALETAWAEREYLGLYDRVVWGKLQGYEQKVWMVWDQRKNTAVRLHDWLTR